MESQYTKVPQNVVVFVRICFVQKSPSELRPFSNTGIPFMTLKEFPETSTEHHTDKFKLTNKQGSILVRRGQSFKVSQSFI